VWCDIAHFGCRSLKFKGPQLWNRLPNALTDINDDNDFIGMAANRLD